MKRDKKLKCLLFKISINTIVFRVQQACSETNRYLHASCQVEGTLDYRISVTLIEFLIGLIDSYDIDYTLLILLRVFYLNGDIAMQNPNQQILKILLLLDINYRKQKIFLQFLRFLDWVNKVVEVNLVTTVTYVLEI